MLLHEMLLFVYYADCFHEWSVAMNYGTIFFSPLIKGSSSVKVVIKEALKLLPLVFGELIVEEKDGWNSSNKIECLYWSLYGIYNEIRQK